MRQLIISKETYDKIKAEIEAYKEEQPKIRQQIAEARAFGDLSENAEYHAAREHLAFVEARIAELGSKLSNSAIFNKKNIDTKKVGYGTTVKVYNPKTKTSDEFTVVGDGEPDPDKDEISMNSPIGAALLDHKVGDKVEADLPFGKTKFVIKKIYVK